MNKSNLRLLDEIVDVSAPVVSNAGHGLTPLRPRHENARLKAGRRVPHQMGSEFVVGCVGVQVVDAQFAGGLFDGTGLLDQGCNRITHDLVAGGVVGGD